MNWFDPNNESVVIFFLCCAVCRIYLEVIQFDFLSLTISKKLSESHGRHRVLRIHRLGLFLSVGYVLLFAPAVLFT